MADDTGIGGAGAASFDGIIKSLPDLVIKQLPSFNSKNGGYTKEGFVQQCAMTLYCNVDFNSVGKTEYTVANECFNRARVLADLLGNKGYF